MNFKRGFLNDGKYKKAIDEVYASSPCPGAKTPRQGKPPSFGGPPHDCDRAGYRGNMDDKMKAEPSGSPERNVHSVQAKMSGSCDGVDSAKNENESPEANDPNGKGKAKVVDVDDPYYDATSICASYTGKISTIPPRPLPRRPGCGRDPEEDLFHRVPESHGGPDVKRAIFRVWPRNPNGKPLEPLTEKTWKTSPDGYAWFETLYDVFWVRRLPSVPNFESVVTGSIMCALMKKLGELDAAAPEIEWAESEGQPRVEAVADTEELIECMDMQLRLTDETSEPDGCNEEDHEKDNKQVEDTEESIECMDMQLRLTDETSEPDGCNEEDHEKDNEQVEDTEESIECMDMQLRLTDETSEPDGCNEEDHEKDNEQVEDNADDAEPAYIPPPPEIPVTSPFHPSHYPHWWPVTPFNKTFPVLLQERIPLYLLPKTLYVHDPFGLLIAREQEFRDTSWTSRPDIVWAYNLHLSGSVGSQVEEAKQRAEELEEFKARTLIVLRYQRTEEQIKNYDPVIEVPLPPYIRRPTQIEESHLYLSPVARVGEGHHSIVYKGEWELPRSIFAKPKICLACFRECTDKEMQRLKDTGRWEKMIKACSWGPKGYTGCRPSQADLNAVNDPPKLENDGEIIGREIICFVSPGMAPSRAIELLEESDIWDTVKKQKEAKTALVYLVPDPVENDSGVPIMRIDPTIPYVGQKPCTHNASALSGRDGPVPRTAKFTVVVKLSLENDPHLSREACNYQQFPDHFFDHYNGYTILNQLKTIVPVSAVVPQFYGYYEPEREEDQELAPGEPSYLSPILLLEHCGTPIEPQELSLEDQEECASLILRFQDAGWLHESIAPRNFLVQYGKPTEFPVMRMANPEPSFRLIDFGRSRRYATAKEKKREEIDTMRMFEQLWFRMAVTLDLGR